MIAGALGAGTDSGGHRVAGRHPYHPIHTDRISYGAK